MSVKLILRLVLAIVFSAFAVLFSELIPPVSFLDPILTRVLVTIAAGLIGFAVFPALASKVTSMTLSLFNFMVSRLTSEILSQMLRIPRSGFHLPFMGSAPDGGGITLQRPLILDTSAIIDGRILDIAKVGFLFGTILIPSSVLTELQQVADSADFLRRNRGRRGFEVIEDLKKVRGVRVEVWDKQSNSKTVDDIILKTAKNLHGRIVTTDFNLNKLAQAHGVAVLNVNDLANALKTVAIPGEVLTVKIVHLGKDPKQGVGYLPDGTMVVVAAGASLVGQNVEVEVTKVLQIPAGRMIFCQIN